MSQPAAAQLSAEQKVVLMTMVMEVNALSTEWISLHDDADKRIEIRQMLKTDVHTLQDIPAWLDHIENLDVVDTDNVFWQSMMILCGK